MKADMITGRRNSAIARLSDHVYVIGGFGDAYLSSCERYSITENTWTAVESMNELRSTATACTLQNKFIYTFGGFNGKGLDSIEKYDAEKDTWTILEVKLPERTG